MSRKVSSNVRLLVIMAIAIAGAALNFFMGTGDGLGNSPLERILWGGFIGAIVGQVIASYADS